MIAHVHVDLIFIDTRQVKQLVNSIYEPIHYNVFYKVLLDDVDVYTDNATEDTVTLHLTHC